MNVRMNVIMSLADTEPDLDMWGPWGKHDCGNPFARLAPTVAKKSESSAVKQPAPERESGGVTPENF